MKTIYEVVAGSYLYGTNLPDSDVDIRGVVVRNLNEILDPFSNFEEKKGQGDTVHYDLKKFLVLCTECNPNIVELLFVPPGNIVIQTKESNLILEYRDYFLSSRVKNTFTGYAYSQLKRINLHRAWLLNPPKKAPIRSEYGLPNEPLYSYEKLQSLVHAPEETIKDEFREYALAENSYRSAKEYWDNYMNWKNTRNPARFFLEEKFGFDTKHGSHLYRLLTEGLELITTGKLTLPRPDKDFLLSIRRGEISYTDLIEITQNLQEKVLNTETVLPSKPNTDKIRELYFKLLKEAEWKI